LTERTRAIVITGPFEDWELELFAKLMRDIERSRPDHTFAMVVDDAEGEGIGEATVLAKIGPSHRFRGRGLVQLTGDEVCSALAPQPPEEGGMREALRLRAEIEMFLGAFPKHPHVPLFRAALAHDGERGTEG
jgi:hypothetical protein